MKLVYFDYCACILLVILVISTILRRMTRGKENGIFLALLVVFLAAAASDVWAVTLDNMGMGHVLVKYISHTMYLMFRYLTIPFYVVYIVALTDIWHKIGLRKILVSLGVPFFAVVLMLFFNVSSGFIFYFDENDTYTRGNGFLLLYVFTIYYVVYGLAILFTYRKLFGKRRWASLLMIFPITLIAALIQYFFPNYLVEMFANAICLQFITIMVKRPEETIDTDTGLGIGSAYGEDMKRSFLNGKPMDIIIVNIANYDSVREMLGYDSFHELLRKIARRLEQVNRRMNIKAELYHLGEGGFRFVIDRRNFDKTEACAQAVNIAMKRSFRINQMEMNLITCVCIVRCPKEIADLDSLMAFENDVDARTYTGEVLYAAQLYRKEYYDVMKDIDLIIERAMTQNRFAVYYQPIYSVNEKRFNSAEALIRLKDDEFGFISPEMFIPAAEKSGAIHKIGNFVLEEVCRFMASGTFEKLNLDYIEVNLSVAQCMQTNLSKNILGTLSKYQISPGQINLEVTETAASYSQNAMMENLQELTRAGIHFSLDDFGTGYSNMHRVASLPLHIVKLDKSLTNIEENPKMWIVLENMIKMIKEMKMKIVVEGIETERLVQQFSNLKCEYIQGYYYSKPLPKDEFVSFIQNAM